MSQSDPADVSGRPWLVQTGASVSRGQLAFRVAQGLVAIGGIIAVNEVAFRTVLDTSYVRWYLANGALITLVAGLVTVAWGDLNKLTGLISANPWHYAGTCLALLVLPQAGYGALLRVDRVHMASIKMEQAAIESARTIEATWDQDKVDQMPEPFRQRIEQLRRITNERAERAWLREPAPAGLGIVDGWLSLVFAPVFVLLWVAWLWVVAPLQYLVNLVAGAPARLALASGSRVWFRVAPHTIAVEEVKVDADPPRGAVEAGFFAKPVTFTAVVAAGLLALASRFV